MDAKRELTSVDLRALVPELRDHCGARVDKAYLYDDDLVRFKLRDFDVGRVELLVGVGEEKRVHRTDPDRVPDAPERPPQFAKMLRSHVANAELVAVDQYGFDRIVTFDFDYDGETRTVVAELFGDGNLVVLDPSGAVIESLETVRLQSRTVAPGSQYSFPDERVDPMDVDFETFHALMEDSDSDVVRTLATQLDLGGTWAEELCTRAGVQKELPIEEAGNEQYEPLFYELESLADRLATADLDPRIYYEDEDPVTVTPVPMEENQDLEATTYDDFNAAIDAYFRELGEDDEPVESEAPDFQSEIETQKHIIQQQQAAIEDFEEQAEAERQTAEALYANYDFVEEIRSTIATQREQGTSWDEIEERLEAGREEGHAVAQAVTDIDREDGLVRVDLDEHAAWIDPTESLEHNADRIYQEAKRIEGKREGAKEAIEETRERLESIKARRDAWEVPDEPATTEEEETTRSDADWLDKPSIPVRQDEQWYERFRWYRTSDGFLVIGGRDADQNEELVKKYLEPGDRFLHTQAHGGPVTILKGSDPSESGHDVTIPEQAEQEAATFAVSYSTVWKDGRFAGDVYAVDHDQVSKTPESGEYLEKGGFAIRGDRDYHRDVAVAVAVGITCEPETRVIGGPPAGITDRTVTHVEVEPGRYAQEDVAKRIYRQLREEFTDTSFVQSVASPDRIQHFLPPGGSTIKDS